MTQPQTKILYRETDDGEQLKIVITTEQGYWCVTGELRESGTRVAHSCGCLHEDILAAAPELEPLVGVHLSNTETGAPMHAIDNAKYFRKGLYEGPVDEHDGRTKEYWFEQLCKHLKMSKDDVRDLLLDTQFDREGFERELTTPLGVVYEHWISLNKVAHVTFQSVGAEGGIPVGEPSDEIVDLGIKFEALELGWDNERKATKYKITLSRPDSYNTDGIRTGKFEFFTGSAAPDPDLDTVLGCLISDARTGEEYADDPDGLADEMGLGVVQAQDLLAEIKEQTRQLDFVLGDVREQAFEMY